MPSTIDDPGAAPTAAAGSEARAAEIVGELRAAAVALPPPEDADAFGAHFDRFADARVVMLGEASHGSAEFYRARAAISRRLIERHGFRIIAIEADWPDAAALDVHVRGRQAAAPASAVFERFPSWMWRNLEMSEFIGWLREYNASRPPQDRVEIRGLDVYSLDRSINIVLAYLDRVDPEEAAQARRRYACLTPWQADPPAYGLAVATGRRGSCEDGAVGQLSRMLAGQIDASTRDGEALFDATQNARIVRAAERYYRLMYRSSTESWNLRDRHMFDTLCRVAEARADAGVIVWAHNSHIGDASATEMGWRGQFNIGELARRRWRHEVALIGFGTDRGTVAAASDWGGPMEVKQVVPARNGSHEAAFRAAGIARSLTDWRGSARPALLEALSAERLERAIGVVYRPETELASHYFDAVLAEQFDAWVWFEQTRAVTPLSDSGAPHEPETWPFGL